MTAGRADAVPTAGLDGRRRVVPGLVVALGVLLAALVVLSLGVGSIREINLKTLFRFLSKRDSAEHLIITTVRLPRSIASMLVGGNLAVAGVLMQGATRNPIASPSIFGVSAGASLVVALWLAITPFGAGAPLVLVAFAGAAAGGVLVLAAGNALGARTNTVRLALAGFAVSAVLTSLTQAVVILDESSADKVLFWLAGSLHNSDWRDVRLLAPWSAAGMMIAVAVAFPLNVLALGEEMASSLGKSPAKTRGASLFAVILLTGVSVAVAGPIGFLGLVAPHIVRSLAGPDHRVVLPLAFLLGAVLMVGADLASRFIAYPFETPSGVLTALVGGPVFVILARNRGVVSSAADRRTSVSRIPVAHPWRRIVLLFVLVAAASLLVHGAGAVRIPLREIIGWIAGADGSSALILSRFRAPRVVSALLAGAALAVSGTLIQAIVRNPLAAPEIVGITRGASLAAVGLSVLFPAAVTGLLDWTALAGGGVAGFLTWLLAYRKGVSGVRLALVGIAVSSIGASMVSMLLALYPQDLNVALLWLTGSLWGRSWHTVWELVPFVVALVPIAVLITNRLDVLALGDATATGLGIRVETLRVVALLVAAILASAAVAKVGAIAFVGLIAPHGARILVGPRHRHLLPASAALGMLILLLADAAGRGLFPPVEIPAGIFTAILGAPYFLILLARTDR